MIKRSLFFRPDLVCISSYRRTSYVVLVDRSTRHKTHRSSPVRTVHCCTMYVAINSLADEVCDVSNLQVVRLRGLRSSRRSGVPSATRKKARCQIFESQSHSKRERQATARRFPSALSSENRGASWKVRILVLLVQQRSDTFVAGNTSFPPFTAPTNGSPRHHYCYPQSSSHPVAIMLTAVRREGFSGHPKIVRTAVLWCSKSDERWVLLYVLGAYMTGGRGRFSGHPSILRAPAPGRCLWIRITSLKLPEGLALPYLVVDSHHSRPGGVRVTRAVLGSWRRN